MENKVIGSKVFELEVFFNRENDTWEFDKRKYYPASKVYEEFEATLKSGGRVVSATPIIYDGTTKKIVYIVEFSSNGEFYT